MKIKLINEPITEDYMKNLLHSRGIEDFEGFIHPSEEDLQRFKDIDDIYAGVKLIAKAIAEKQRIALIVDCDVDGFTSSSILYQYLRRLEPELVIDHYIHDGKQHGLEDMWEKLQSKDYGLILVPDAGSNDSKYADEIETPILVIDHHILEDDVSSNYITLVNNQTSKFYHNKDLSGAGMAYQFCRAMDEVFEKDWADDYIDLAALGVCADMMSGLEIENQYLWKKGFSKVNNYFFLTVARKQAYSITGKMNATDAEIFEALNPTSVAFYIVPMINAMIRIGTEAEKERLFTAFVDGHRLVPSNKRGAKGTMEEVAVESVRECTNARNHQNKRRDEVMERLEQKIFKHDLLENEVLFIRLDDDDDFPSVLNGLVAMQLSAKYKKPTIVARLNDEGYVRGSARGLNASELASFKDFLNSTGLFEYTAGHDNAFGISIANKDLDKFHTIANERLAAYDFGEDFYEVNFCRHAFDADLVDIIYDLGQYKHIWSQQNDEALIYVDDINLTPDDIQVIGKNKDTLRFEKNGIVYIKFFAKDLIEELKQHNDIKLEVVATANLNSWMGRTTPQLAIKAYEVKNGRLEF